MGFDLKIVMHQLETHFRMIQKSPFNVQFAFLDLVKVMTCLYI